MADIYSIKESDYLVHIPVDATGIVELKNIVTFSTGKTELKADDFKTFTMTTDMGNKVKKITETDATTGNETKSFGGKSSNKKAGKKTSKKGGRRRGKTRKSK